MIEKVKLFRLVIFNFSLGMKTCISKTFMLIRRENKVELSPAYDLVNTTLVGFKAREEIALPIRGKKNKLTHTDLVTYFGMERLGLPDAVIKKELSRFEHLLMQWKALLVKSFLSKNSSASYAELIQKRLGQTYTEALKIWKFALETHSSEKFFSGSCWLAVFFPLRIGHHTSKSKGDSNWCLDMFSFWP